MESIPTDNARLTAAIRDGSREAFDECAAVITRR